MELPCERKTFSLKAMLPSSLLSVAVHALILLMAGLSLRGCEKGAPVEAGGRDYREIGLAFVPDQSPAETEQPAQNPQDAVEVQPSDADPLSLERPVVPTEAPKLTELLGREPSSVESTDSANPVLEVPNIVGAGTPIGGLPTAGGGLPELIRPKGKSGQGSAGSPTPGPGETSFMNIVGNGSSFVYVIDTSSSMGSDGRLDLAKNQLKASLRMLRPNQKFQVLFYGESTVHMKLRNRPAQPMYAATTVQSQLAADEIERVVPQGGTEHRTPILHALMLEPDVVYFLTDGEQPRLTPANLAEIRSKNRSGAQLHVIEFASGPRESRHISWLQLLASQSGGTYKRLQVQ